ncbi:SURF1 family protein [Piscinibacter sp.]|uniref:SURF1 family protein n=1 Tax=Piscinibacter sp. TaxID=1903157 RepID=UPI002CE55BF7|nr:SURF1 family protein [Albitalea sp.]HUG23815.1 SURF1 family protein [Albitalea sp.]
MTPRARALTVLLATLVSVAATARLGLWQLDRAAQKQALQHALDERGARPLLAQAELAETADAAAAQHYRRIRLQGWWVNDRTVFLDNRQMNARPGFFVVTPLQLARSDRAVLVQRGWVPRDAADRTRLPPVRTPSGEVEVVGHIAPPPARLYEFADAATGAIRQNLDLTAFARETGLRLAPLSVVQDAVPVGPDDGLMRQWPRPAVDVHKHYGYAFQWFALCALMAGLYVWFQLVRPRLRSRR